MLSAPTGDILLFKYWYTTMVSKSPCVHAERRGGGQGIAHRGELLSWIVRTDYGFETTIWRVKEAFLQWERCLSVPPVPADPPEPPCSWGWAGRGLLWAGELGSQQRAAAVGDQNKQRNGLETAKGLKALACVAQPGYTKGLCNLVLKHPEGLSRRSGSFQCSQFPCGSGYLGRHVGTELLALLWSEGLPAVWPCSWPWGSEVVVWSPPGRLAWFGKPCSFLRGQEVFWVRGWEERFIPWGETIRLC